MELLSLPKDYLQKIYTFFSTIIYNTNFISKPAVAASKIM